MDLWQLRVFTKVIDLEGFSKAADAVHLTQPTVSSHVRDLEAYFGCRLVDRMGRRAVTTRAGEVVYKHARRLLEMAGQMETELAEFLGTVEGEIALGGSTIPGGYILPRLIGEFKKTYPGVRIRVYVGDTEQIVNDIIALKLDFGIVGAETDKSRIAQKAVIKDAMKLVVRSDHKWGSRDTVFPEELAKEPFIIREQGSGTLKSFEKRLKSAGFNPESLTVTAELGSTASVIQGIKSGIGVSVISPVAVSDELRAGSLKALDIKGVDLTRHFYLTFHTDRTPSPACRAFMDYLEEAAAKIDS
ncbi:MAG: LysR family transcriptional regulator [Desulfobacteraceae bacterium]|nr:LysR family transcriptional regulator [Desulfobacteraceae bacterium]